MPTDDGSALALSPTALETKTYSVAQLLEAIRKGRIRIPYFQRRFKWQDADRLLLFDSLQKGYPIGTLLIAQGSAPKDRVVLGGFETDVPEVLDALWVVDGQQRLSTLAMALLGDHQGTYRPIYFDLQKNRFVLGARKRAPPHHMVPTHVLASSASLIKWLRDAGVAEELSDRADQIASRIREYQLPAYLVPWDGEDHHLLTEIFARMNRSKRALTSDEVFQALHSSRTEGKPIDRVRNEVSKIGFGELDEKQIERAALALVTKEPRGTLVDAVTGWSEAQVAALFARVSQGLLRAVEFLVEDASVPHIAWLPYGGVLATLTRLFDAHPKLHERNRELLARWYWRGNLTGDHHINNRTDGPKWQAIVADEHESIQGLLKLAPSLDVSKTLASGLHPYNRVTARTRIELIALAALEPRLLAGEERGQPVPLASLLEEPQDFPTQIAEAKGVERTIAGYWLHPKIDLGALREWPPAPELLESHGMDGPMLATLLAGDEAAFLEQRTKALTAHVCSTLRLWTAVDAFDHDRAPLDSYFDSETA